MTEQPLVSVIVPVYDEVDLVEQAVESVVEQTYSNVEICLVDSSGKTSVQALAASYDAVRYEYMPPEGAAAARNAGLELARGDLVAFLDADDYWRPQKLTRQVPVIRDGGADLVFSGQEVVDL